MISSARCVAMSSFMSVPFGGGCVETPIVNIEGTGTLRPHDWQQIGHVWQPKQQDTQPPKENT